LSLDVAVCPGDGYGSTVYAEQIIGDVEGRPTAIVDDMISTGGTIEAAIGVLLSCGPPPTLS
jgi:ribose-phosphate pyrophosphokinase